MSGVLGLGPRLPVAAAVALAVVLHAGIAVSATAAMFFSDFFKWNRELRGAIALKLDSEYELEMVKPEPPPPPPPENEPPPPVVKDVPQKIAKDQPEPPPPPAPARAAAVLTAESAKDAPPDLVDFTTGTATTFTGGQSAANGMTTNGPVRNLAAAVGGTPGGTGTGPVSANKADKSRAASLSEAGRNWRECPFPDEANAEQIDSAVVMLQVRVGTNGSPESVTVVKDSGHGFGREARKCALRKTYTNALDADGNAVAGQTKPFNVRFDR